MSAAAVASPSCFFNKRNRAGLFLNSRFTCVAECLERMLLNAVDDVMAQMFEWPIRPMDGCVLLATVFTIPTSDIFFMFQHQLLSILPLLQLLDCKTGYGRCCCLLLLTCCYFHLLFACCCFLR